MSVCYDILARLPDDFSFMETERMGEYNVHWCSVRHGSPDKQVLIRLTNFIRSEPCPSSGSAFVTPIRVDLARSQLGPRMQHRLSLVGLQMRWASPACGRHNGILIFRLPLLFIERFEHGAGVSQVRSAQLCHSRPLPLLPMFERGSFTL